MKKEIVYTSTNGFSGRLYGESSLSIFKTDSGKEVLHTGSRNINTMEELKKEVEEFPAFLKILEETTKDKE